jgi:hypothetical protein
MRTVTDQIRGGLMCCCILLVAFVAWLTAIIPAGRIDSPEEFVMSIRSAKGFAMPLAISVFLLILTLPRPVFWRRGIYAVCIGLALWVFVWQFLVHSAYAQIRAKGGDPERMIQSAKTE